MLRRRLACDRRGQGRAAFLLRPIHDRLLQALKASPKLFVDETTAPVLDPGRGLQGLEQALMDRPQQEGRPARPVGQG